MKKGGAFRESYGQKTTKKQPKIERSAATKTFET